MNKPNRKLNWLQEIIDANKAAFQKSDRIVLIGIRGYFRDSMGAKGANDRKIWDDAFFIVDTVTGWFAAWNGNVDPNGYRIGRGTGSTKGMACLKEGVWRYKKGTHKGYEAFVQAAKVTVIRDGKPNYEDTGYFGINIHKGGVTSTSSLGCQTIPASQWSDFKETLYKKLTDVKQSTFPYVLITKQG